MLREFVRLVANFILRILFNVKIVNLDRFKTLKSGCIITPNHISFWETVIVPVFSKRVMYMMAKEELFNGKFMNWFLKKLKAFPVKRGKNDLGAIKAAVKFLREGKSICMFPEGTRSKNGMIKFKTGAVMLAVTGKVPIIPVGISASFKFRSKVNVIYGEPIYFTEYYDKKLTKEELTEATKKVEDAVKKLIKAGE